jgi:hypothetical protein
LRKAGAIQRSDALSATARRLGVTVTGPERLHTLLSLSKGADQPQAAAGGRIQRPHRMPQPTMDVAVANRAQAAPALRCRAEINRAGVLDRHTMPAGCRTGGVFAPAGQQRRNLTFGLARNRP